MAHTTTNLKSDLIDASTDTNKYAVFNAAADAIENALTNGPLVFNNPSGTIALTDAQCRSNLLFNATGTISGNIVFRLGNSGVGNRKLYLFKDDTTDIGGPWTVKVVRRQGADGGHPGVTISANKGKWHLVFLDFRSPESDTDVIEIMRQA